MYLEYYHSYKTSKRNITLPCSTLNSTKQNFTLAVYYAKRSISGLTLTGSQFTCQACKIQDSRKVSNR